MRAKATPEGYHTLNPFLRVADTAAALHFYKTAFGAKEDFRREMHGRLMIGDSRLMISDHTNEPEKVAGATEAEPLKDHFFGERSGDVTDPFGFTWRLAQFVEDVPHAEIERRIAPGSRRKVTMDVRTGRRHPAKSVKAVRRRSNLSGLRTA
jgi:PhnB protein